MDLFSMLLFAVGFIAVLTVWKGIKIVPQQQAWVVERLGRFHSTLEPGLNLLIPYIDNVSYKHSLKEQAVDIPEQTGITRDNVTLVLDGILYVRVVDAVEASYGVSDPILAVTLLAQTTMRSEIGKLTLDKTFEERELLNTNIVTAINQAAQSWGVQCMRYEIKNINPPSTVLKAMELQVAAERRKRAEILDSEGRMQSQINLAEAAKREVVLESEASMTDQINRSKGEAQAILAVAEATAEGLEKVGAAIQKDGGIDAVSLQVAKQYVEAFSKLAKESNTVLLPANANDIGGMVAQALTTYEAIRDKSGSALSAGKSRAVKSGPARYTGKGDYEDDEGGSGPWGSA